MYRAVGLIVLALAFVAVSGQSICPGNEEFWPDENCSKYWQCNNGNPILGECPGELFWNPSIDSCDFSQNVPECQGGTRPPTGTTPAITTTRASTTTRPTSAVPTTTVPTTTVATTTRPTSAVPTTTVQTSTVPTTTRPTSAVPTTGRPTEETPETEGTGSPPTRPPSTTELPPGVCPATGVVKIAHEERCDLYYLCVDGTRLSEIFQCADGLWFDPIIRECNQQTEVQCTPVTTTIPTTSERPNIPECPDAGVIQLPYPGNCTLYILCIEGVPILYRCPEGYLFDFAAAQCMPENIAVCLTRNPFKFDHHRHHESTQDKKLARPRPHQKHVRPHSTEHAKKADYWSYLKSFIDSSK